jgi:hypothetical protein
VPAVLLLLAVYITGAPPLAYMVGRGWVSEPTFRTVYAPLEMLLGPREGKPSLVGDFVDDSIEWFHEVGQRHRVSL